MNSARNSLKLSGRFEEICYLTIPGFVIDDDNRQVIGDLKKYIDRDESCPYDINKSICLMGNPGSGKTELLRAMQTTYRESGHPLAFGFDIVWKIAEEFSETGWNRLKKIMKGNWFLDELFRREKEKTGFMHYKVDMADCLIHRRQKLFNDYGFLTHWTTNKTEDEIREMEDLDDSTYSRLMHMSNMVVLIGPDRRKTAQLKSVIREKETEKIPTEEEKEKIQEDFIMDRIILPWRNFLKTGQMIFPVGDFSIYDTLDKLAIKIVDEERKTEISIKARQTVKARHWQEQDFRAKYTKDKNDPEIVEKIRMECKRISVREFFTECKDNGVDLEKLIIQHQKKSKKQKAHGK
jgi:nucleoside-triphosphatase THEP1